MITEKPKYKCFVINERNRQNKMIINHLGLYSRNIYNIVLYCKQVHDLYKNRVYKELQMVSVNNVDEWINEKFLFYHSFHSEHKKFIDNNNKIIYKIIKDTSEHININNQSIESYVLMYEYMFMKNKDIYKKDDYNDIFVTNIIKNILYSKLHYLYSRTKEELLDHKPLTCMDEILIDEVKNKVSLKENNNYFDYKSHCNYTLKTDKNYVGRMVYKCLGNNAGKIDSTMIGTIIDKVYSSYSSYFALKKKGYKAQKPKFKKYNEKYLLNYCMSKCKIEGKMIRIFTSQHLSKNFTTEFPQYKKFKNNVVHQHYCLQKKTKMSTKKRSYIKNKSFCPKHFYIPLPDQIKNEKIKTIEFKFINGTVKICYNYEFNDENIAVTPTVNDSISIDIGVKNLLTIYDPTGMQHIIPGNFLLSTNHYFRKNIAKKQSKSKSYNNALFKRSNIISNYFNLVTKWLYNNYKHKKMIIIGYNLGWKNKTNLGRENNFLFNKIPFCQLISKIKNKFNTNNIIVKTTEESYTSKCDSLNLEQLEKQNHYSGNRNYRGLFSSSIGKYINADVNGAINIMRKVFKIVKVTGLSLFNPLKINIFREVLPADNRDIVLPSMLYF